MVLAHKIYEGDDSPKRTADIATDRDVTFENMLLGPRTLAGLTVSGFTRPSPVQLQGIPSGKCGFNLLLEAKSGTGKTAVFVTVALELLELQADAQTLILAPTREIAAQIKDVIRQIGSNFKDLKVEVVMGGLPVSEDIKKFENKRRVNIIVGSPGRLRHLIEQNHINTNSVRLFVLDEADKLMESSFKADINYIFSSLPNCKQVIMSSATYPEDLKEIVKKYMKKFVHICPNSTSVLLGIEQRMTLVKQHANVASQTQYRYTELVKILKSRQFKQCLIFCNYQARVVELCLKLKTDKWPVQSLHGKQEQTDRLDALKTLQDYKCRILVSTDLAARGIDASNVDLVINFEPPYEWTTYLHRIGRAGRYGSYGMAVSIIAQGKEEKEFRELLKNIGAPVNMKVLWTEEPVSFGETNGHSENGVHLNGATHQSPKKDTPIATEEIWDFLIDKNDDTQEHDKAIILEDFNKLNMSYNDIDKIENFKQLIESFENEQHCKVDIPFVTLKINFKSNSSKTPNNSETKIEEINQNESNETEDLEIKPVEKHNQLKQKSKAFTEYPLTSKRVSPQDQNQPDETAECKEKNNKLNEPVYYDYGNEESYDDDESLEVYSTSDSEDSSDTETSSDDDESYTDRNINKEILKLSERLSRQMYLTARARNYAVWKRQLQARTNQIQLMLYIQELAKMNIR